MQIFKWLCFIIVCLDTVSYIMEFGTGKRKKRVCFIHRNDRWYRSQMFCSVWYINVLAVISSRIFNFLGGGYIVIEKCNKHLVVYSNIYFDENVFCIRPYIF